MHVAARAAHADDLGHQLLVAAYGVADFVLRYCAVEGDRDHVTVDEYDFSGGCHGDIGFKV